MPPQNATSNGIVRIEDKRQRPPKLHDLPSLQKLGRVISTCYVHGEDIEAWTTRSGWALAYLKSSLWTTWTTKRPKVARTVAVRHPWCAVRGRRSAAPICARPNAPDSMHRHDLNHLYHSVFQVFGGAEFATLCGGLGPMCIGRMVP